MSSLVPEVWKIVKNGPWDIKTLRKTNFVLILIFYGRFGPWLESLVKLHVWPPKFESLAEKVPGNKNGKLSKMAFVLFMNDKYGPYDDFGKIS